LIFDAGKIAVFCVVTPFGSACAAAKYRADCGASACVTTTCIVANDSAGDSTDGRKNKTNKEALYRD